MATAGKVNLRDLTKLNYKNLRYLNLAVGYLNVTQALVIVVLASSLTGLRGIFSTFLTSDSLSGGQALVPATHHWFDFNLTYAVVAFLLASAIIRLGVATRYRKDYESDLRKKNSQARWLEYAVVGSFVILTAAIVSGVQDLGSLILIFVVAVLASFLNLITETNLLKDKKAGWVSVTKGLRLAFIPWAVIVVYIWGSHVYGSGLPAYIYWLDTSLLVLSVAMVSNFYRGFKKTGRWADYLYGERTFILLSFITTTAAAWQVYAGTLR